jgi:A/G-specific adenine glycosylase
MKPKVPSLCQLLLSWYKENHRDLPWRKDRDPYRIWISEVMLQQTTVAAVIPYYERFLKSFPTVKALAKAPREEVLSMWAGLGYYSRARNLHKAAQMFAGIEGFPKTAAELLEAPGFGPYTSRAVASLAFGEAVGVLDGNVIRVLTRVFGIDGPWWTTHVRNQLQSLSDQLAAQSQNDSHNLNQGLMELGATVCTPQNPACLLCPWKTECVARKQNKIENIPQKKPRKQLEVWVWKPTVYQKGTQIALVQNNYAPFLKGQLIFPGSIQKQNKKPKAFDLKHGITHHDIYIKVQKVSSRDLKSADDKGMLKWVAIQKIAQVNPSSLLKKVIEFLDY